jgi:hypothetical protein
MRNAMTAISALVSLGIGLSLLTWSSGTIAQSDFVHFVGRVALCTLSSLAHQVARAML